MKVIVMKRDDGGRVAMVPDGSVMLFEFTTNSRRREGRNVDTVGMRLQCAAGYSELDPNDQTFDQIVDRLNTELEMVGRG